jgi:hypothetical protein
MTVVNLLCTKPKSPGVWRAAGWFTGSDLHGEARKVVVGMVATAPAQRWIRADVRGTRKRSDLGS